MSWNKFNAWLATTDHAKVVVGYHRSVDNTCHGFRNYATYNVARFIFPECVIKGNYLKEKAWLPLEITPKLAGIHFNSANELEAYITTFHKLDSVKADEYTKVAWAELFGLMDMSNDYGVAVDVSLKRSWYEELNKINPNHGLSPLEVKVGLLKTYLDKYRAIFRPEYKLELGIEIKKICQSLKSSPKIGEEELDSLIARA